jgi:hypothetical protein
MLRIAIKEKGTRSIHSTGSQRSKRINFWQTHHRSCLYCRRRLSANRASNTTGSAVAHLLR